MTRRQLTWCCYPLTRRPPDAVEDALTAFTEAAPRISSTDPRLERLTSTEVLGALHDGLVQRGFDVEAPGHTVRLPVLFGDAGKPRRRFRADAWNPETRVVIEVEAGGARQNNRALLDLLKGVVWADCQHLIVAVKHAYGQTNQDDYNWLRDWAELLYVSDRIALPFDSLTVVGY